MTAPIEVSGTAGAADLLPASSISDFRAVVGSVYRITIYNARLFVFLPQNRKNDYSRAHCGV